MLTEPLSGNLYVETYCSGRQKDACEAQVPNLIENFHVSTPIFPSQLPPIAVEAYREIHQCEELKQNIFN